MLIIINKFAMHIGGQGEDVKKTNQNAGLLTKDLV